MHSTLVKAGCRSGAGWTTTYPNGDDEKSDIRVHVARPEVGCGRGGLEALQSIGNPPCPRGLSLVFVIGADVGGTFIDAAAVRLEDGTIYTAKARSTPPNLVSGLLESIGLLAEQAEISVEQLLAGAVKFAHGTTLTSNVIFTGNGATTGLLTTRGFADELLIMRARGRVAGISQTERRHLSATNKPPQIVPRERIEEIAERVDHRGRVLVPLDPDEVVAAVERLLALGLESLAISFLWSPQNPAHELAAERVVRERWPGLHVSVSHRLASVLGEYERASTAVVNAWVAPKVEGYMESLEATLRELGLRCPLLIVQASGGVVQAEDAVPIHTVESGPAAGMVAVRALADAVGARRVIATDVGGTTFKVGLLTDGEWAVAGETIVNQYALLVPMIDLVSIGAGGGSIAWVDDDRLRIGPDSAGADPGPAAYGWGGTRPTVTDADVVLGFVNPARFLGGRLPLDAERARAAIQSEIADRLFDGDVIAAAAAIRRVVDAQMGDLIRKSTIEHGHDPRHFVLVAYGGAGPLHAADYARGLGLQTIIVPGPATAYSAYGAAASDVTTTVQSSVAPEAADDQEVLDAAFRRLEADAAAFLARQAVASDAQRLSRWADIRYVGQLHDVRVPLSARATTRDGLKEAFETRYAVLYGAAGRIPAANLRVLRIGVDAVGSIAKPPVPSVAVSDNGPPRRADETRKVFWPSEGAWIGTDVHDGPALSPGDRLIGPAIVDQPGTTVVVPSGAVAVVDAGNNIVITLGARE